MLRALFNEFGDKEMFNHSKSSRNRTPTPLPFLAGMNSTPNPCEGDCKNEIAHTCQ
jgi:hypothetical protein